MKAPRGPEVRFLAGRLVLTFMSFMMTWNSPPKALHSFSIPASIFPQARKNSQLPKAQTFTSSKNQRLDRFPQYSDRGINRGLYTERGHDSPGKVRL